MKIFFYRKYDTIALINENQINFMLYDRGEIIQNI